MITFGDSARSSEIANWIIDWVNNIEARADPSEDENFIDAKYYFDELIIEAAEQGFSIE